MSGKFFIFVYVTAALCVIIQAASYSRSCIYLNGELKCSENNDPNGNFAGSAGAVNGQGGSVASGAGYPGSFTVNRDEIRNGNGYIPPANVGIYYPPYNGGAPAVGAAAGNFYPPGFPPFNNPNQFVQDFMRGRR